MYELSYVTTSTRLIDGFWDSGVHTVTGSDMSSHWGEEVSIHINAIGTTVA